MNNEKIKVWNWQRVHGENASVQDWVYQMLGNRITTSDRVNIKIIKSGEIAYVGDYLVWFRDTDELRIVKKDDFEANYERMT